MESVTNSNSSVPAKRGPKDFLFGRVLGEGSFSTVKQFFLYYPRLLDLTKSFSLFIQVYLAKDVQTNKEFASISLLTSHEPASILIIYLLSVKVCDKHHIIRERKQQYIQREKEGLKQLSDNTNPSAPFFVRLYCTFQDESSLC